MKLTYKNQIDSDLCVSLDEAKRHLRVIHNEDDVDIQMLIYAGIEYVESYTGRFLNRYEKVFRGTGNRFYIDGGEVNVQYVVDVKSGLKVPYNQVDGCIVLDSVSEVDISVHCGYDYKDVPKMLRYAVLMYIGALYESRSDITYGVQSYKMPITSENLIRPYIIWRPQW